jgi:hypothetical protein
MIAFNNDAFTHSQVESKIWLCEELENLNWYSDTTHIYAGWYAITAFLLLSRGKFKVNQIESFDLDPNCKDIANMINEAWKFQKRFGAFTEDCSNPIVPLKGTCDLIINTASEHFETMDWFNNLPSGMRVIIQGNNMIHDDEHTVHTDSLESFINYYPLSEYNYTGTKDFSYTEFSFTRYMIIGTK